ncbi:MAG: SUMF1/EgtB/PvdO family nonheme iron enzyme [Planctomycetota bacterium]
MTSAAPAVTRFAFLLCSALIASPIVGQSSEIASGNGNAAAGQEHTAFPTDLTLIPSGKVSLGTPADTLLDVTKAFHPRAPSRRLKLLAKLLSELGERDAEVDEFYLNKIPVTNEQYLQFVQATGHRFPYHWWKLGKPDDFKETRPKARAAFKEETLPELYYWEQYYRDLPYAIPEGAEHHPVTFVSWRDAAAFAGWAGMRLPTEAEWVYAASGADRREFLWGQDWDKEWLKKLKLYQSRDKKVKDVGVLGDLARGEFGHEDMVANVWEWTAEIGYFPVAGEDSFRKEMKKVLKQSFVKDLAEPDWDGGKRILKGGSYFSWQQPAELRIQTRAPVSGTQTLEGAGFRLAKSSVPGRDMCRSRLAVEYDSSFFGADREPVLDDQMGVERYDLSDDGRLITNYHSVSFIPVNHMALGKANLNTVREQGRERPLIVGTLVTTEPTSKPEAPAGIYTVMYRPKGMPKELESALKQANRELMAQRKAAASGKEPKKSSSKKKKKGPDWSAILSKYGITEDEAAEKGAATKIKHVVLKPGALKVSTEKHMLVLRDNEGNHVAATDVSGALAKKSGYKGASLSISTEDNKEKFVFDVGAKWTEKTKTSFLLCTVPVVLTTPPDMSRPWRAPEGVDIEGPRASGGGQHNVAPSGGR